MDYGFIIPIPTLGQGGIRTIIQIVNKLVCDKNSCTVYIDGINSTLSTLAELQDVLYCNYSLNKSAEVCSDVKVKDQDAIIITSWDTAYNPCLQDKDNVIYLIQDYEPYFYSMGSQYLKAKQTYTNNYNSLTIGKWLYKKISLESKGNVAYFNFGVDNKIYKRITEIKKEDAICAILQPDKPRRCGQLLIETLNIFHKYNSKIKIYLYGTTKETFYNNFGLMDLIKFKYDFLGSLKIEECNKLYNKCKLGISMSSTNPSRVSFEMMATGLPTIDLLLENNLYDFNDSAIQLVEPEPIKIASAIATLLEDDSKLTNMQQQALKFMKGRTIDKEVENAASIITKYANHKSLKPQKIQQYKHVALPINSKIKQITNDFNDLNTENENVYYCENLEVTINPLSQKEADYKIAIWSSPDQADLLWINLVEHEEHYSCVVPIDYNKDNSKTCLIHFYEIDKSNNTQLMLYGTNVNLTKNKSSNRKNTKELDKKSYTPYHEFRLSTTDKSVSINQTAKKGFLQKVMSKIIKS